MSHRLPDFPQSTLARERINDMEQLPQAQYDLTTQLNELYAAANKLGLYDAADYLAPGARVC